MSGHPERMPSREGNADDEVSHEPSATTPLLKAHERRPDSGRDEDGSDIDTRWKAEDNTRNPRNWKFGFKWMTVALVSFIEFLT